MFAPDHVLVIVQLLPEVLLLLGRLVDFALAYLCVRIHHILILVNFWCFEIVKRQNLDGLFVGSVMVDLLLVDEMFVVAHVVEDAGDAHELKFGFFSYGIVVNWGLVTNGTFILLLNSRSFVGSSILGPLHLSGSTPSSLRLFVLLLREVANCLKSPMRTSSADGCNCVLDDIDA